MAPPGEYVEALRSIGVQFVPWHVDRRGLNPLTELGSLVSLRHILKTIRPDVLHSLTIKPNIYGAVGVTGLGIGPRIASVVGLGYPFTNSSIKARLLRLFLFPLYRVALQFSDVVTFENDWDLLHLAKPKNSAGERYIIGGTGIDLSKFDPEHYPATAGIELKRELGISPDDKVVILVARMLEDKGISEYVAAAAALQNRHPDTRFLLVGPMDEGNPAAISAERLSQWHQEGTVQYLGERSDVPEMLSMADLVVLPTYWEGNPVSLMEAAAMGKPMVASDIPGCRMVVEHGKNGLLVPPKSERPLADAIEKILLSEDLQSRFGKSAYEKARNEFDEQVVAERFLKLYRRLLSNP